MRLLCSIHADDHVHLIHHPGFDNKLFWCPECHALWFTLENVLRKDQMFGVTFTRAESLETLLAINGFWDVAVDVGVYDSDIP